MAIFKLKREKKLGTDGIWEFLKEDRKILLEEMTKIIWQYSTKQYSPQNGEGDMGHPYS